MGAVPTGASKVRTRIVNGQLATRVDKDTPNAKPRTYKIEETGEEKTVYEIYSGGWHGKIVSLTRTTGGKFGETIIIGMNDGQESIEIEMMIDSGYALDFMKRYLSGDFFPEKDVLVSPFEIEEGKKKKYYFMLTQGENKIKSPFTKEYQENPNNTFRLPEWEPIQVGPGKIMYNKTAQIEFLWKWIVKKSMKSDPTFQAKVVQAAAQSAPSVPSATNQPPAQNMDAYMKSRDAAIAAQNQLPQTPQSTFPTPTPTVPTPTVPTPQPQQNNMPWGAAPVADDDDLPF
jgi:hypothetical protein